MITSYFSFLDWGTRFDSTIVLIIDFRDLVHEILKSEKVRNSQLVPHDAVRSPWTWLMGGILRRA
jgi:hypothetical protein